MRQVAQIDSQGYFAADVLLEDCEELEPDMVPHGPPDGFFSPRWNAARSEWDEGATEEELFAKAIEAKRREIEDEALEAIANLFSTSRPEYEALLYISIALTSTTNDDLTKEAKQEVRAIVDAGKVMRERFAALAEVTSRDELEGV